MYFRTREDDAWRYQTTSSQYGQFYKAIDRENQRYKGQHGDCEMQEARLREELHEAKACLEMINQGGQLANQRGPCCFDASARGRECPCRQKQPVSKNRNNLNSLEAWNCGQNPEPEFLEDHVNCYHPRVGLKPLIPKITFGYSSKNGWWHERCAGGIVQDEGLEAQGIRERFNRAQQVQGVVSTAIGVAVLNETKGRMFCPTLRDTASTDTMDWRGKVRRPAKATVPDFKL